MCVRYNRINYQSMALQPWIETQKENIRTKALKKKLICLEHLLTKFNLGSCCAGAQNSIYDKASTC